MSSKKDSKDKKNDSRYGKQVKPKRKTSKPRRETFAKWVTSGKNPFFARAFVNRIWAHFMGKGFVNPVDDFTSESRVIYPELLDFLAADFVASKFDIKRLIEIIVSTKSYRLRALEGVPGGVAKGESHDYFSMMPIRPLPAEVLARSVLRATGMEEPHPKKNARQVQRYLKKAKDMFARRFGVDESEMRQEFQGTVLQALLLFNGEFTDGKAPAARVFHASYEKELSGSLDAVLEGARPEQQIDKLFMNILTRRPTDDELQPFMQHVLSRRTDKDRQKALADVQWALLNSAEFLHQH